MDPNSPWVNSAESILHANDLNREEAIQALDDLNKGVGVPNDSDALAAGGNFLLELTPGYGDYVAFESAESWGDYAIATAGILPFGKIIKIGGKFVKVETKVGLALVDKASRCL